MVVADQITVAEQITVYPAPASPESLVSLKPRYENFIGGHWVAPVEGEYSANASPATGLPFCEVARSTAPDVDLALDAAHAAREAWGETSTADRAKVLNAIADAIEANLEMLAVAESWENGKPVRETLNADLPLAIDHFRYFAGAIRGEEAGSPKSTRTRSPTTSVNRSASSGRSSRSTSHC
jgi:aldehyde dehydrogenase